MTRKESMSHWYQLKKKFNNTNVTNASRVKCEMRRICESHQVLPSLVSDCPHCQQIIKKLKKQGTESKFIQDKLKPFIHNYAKLFCNEMLLKVVMGNDFKTTKKTVPCKDNENKKVCAYRLRNSNTKEKFANMHESIWSFVETNTCSSRDETKSESKEKVLEIRRKVDKHRVRTVKKNHDSNSLSKKDRSTFESCKHYNKSSSNKHKSKSKFMEEKVRSNSGKQLIASEDKMRTQKLPRDSLTSISENTSLVKLWSESERKNPSVIEQVSCASVNFRCHNTINREGHYFPDTPELIRLSSGTDGEINTLCASTQEHSKHHNQKKTLKGHNHTTGKTNEQKKLSKSPQKKNNDNKEKSEREILFPQEKSIRVQTKVVPDVNELNKPDFVAKYIGKHFNRELQPNVRYSTVRQAYPDYLINLRNQSVQNKWKAGMNYPNVMHLQKRDVGNSGWNIPMPQNEYRPTYQLFNGTGNYQDSINNVWNNESTGVGKSSVLSHSFKNYRVPLSWNQNVTPNAFKNPFSSQNISNPHSLLYPPKYFHENLIHLKEKHLGLPKNLPEIFYFNRKFDKIEKKANFMDRNLQKAAESSLLLKSDSSCFKHKTRKFKSGAKPYSIESHRLKKGIPIYRRRTACNINMSDILRKFLGTEYKIEILDPQKYANINIQQNAQNEKKNDSNVHNFNSQCNFNNSISKDISDFRDKQGHTQGGMNEIYFNPTYQDVKNILDVEMNNFKYNQGYQKDLKVSNFNIKFQKIKDILEIERNEELSMIANNKKIKQCPENTTISTLHNTSDRPQKHEKFTTNDTRNVFPEAEKKRNAPKLENKDVSCRNKKFLRKRQKTKTSTLQCQKLSKSNVDRFVRSQPQDPMNTVDKNEQCNRKSGRFSKKWKKYFEVNSAKKVDHFLVEHVPKPLEPLLSKIIHPGTLSNVNVLNKELESKQCNNNSQNKNKR